MSYFDVPVGRCEVMQIMVMTDQTEAECTLDNGCPAGRHCTLAASLNQIHSGERAPCSAAGKSAPA